MTKLYDFGLEQTADIWGGLPTHIQEKAEAPYVLAITLKTKEDLENLSALVKQKKLDATMKTNVYSIWYPQLEAGERGSNSSYIWVEA